MINKIISAICLALSTHYGEGYDVYKESIEQGLQEPCFFVQIIAPVRDRQSPKRLNRQGTAVIQYFPEHTEYYAEDNVVFETLCEILEEITVDDCVIRGDNISSNIDDNGVLSFQIDYQWFEYDNAAETNMEFYTETTTTKR